MNETNANTAATLAHPELTFFADASAPQESDAPWTQTHLDIVIPLFLIGIGLFQLVLRKWILPVPYEIISRLEDQLPTQGLIYMPQLGLFFIIIGTIMLVLFNI